MPGALWAGKGKTGRAEQSDSFRVWVDHQEEGPLAKGKALKNISFSDQAESEVVSRYQGCG